jgi:hypothetical protein
MVKLLALHHCQAIFAAALITVGLCNLIADYLRRGFELLRQLLRRTTSPYQLDHLLAEFRRIRGVLSSTSWTPKLKQMGVQETGSTSINRCPISERRAVSAKVMLHHRTKSNIKEADMNAQMRCLWSPDYFHLRLRGPNLKWLHHGSTAALRTTASVYPPKRGYPNSWEGVREICWQRCNGNVTVLPSGTAIGHRQSAA